LDTEAERTALARRFGPETDLELLPTLDYDPFLASLREVAVGLCPLIADSPFSRGKSFGKILGYLHAGVPVVASDAADHAVFFTPDAGVVSNDLAVWEAAVRTLLADPKARDAMATRADALFRERLSIEAAARLTDRFLRELIAASQRLD
jgi:glycosyltransferase involved in cell wall biosynthesis